MKKACWIPLLVAAACRGTPESGDAEPEAVRAPERAPLPAGFAVRTPPKVEPPFLAPEATWRWLVSRLTTLRADARARRRDLLVTFESNALHLTERSGLRHTWRLPEGLRLVGGPTHVLLKADLTLAVYGPDGKRRPARAEIPVIRARIQTPGGVQEFRLVVKGGTAFRSISTAG